MKPIASTKTVRRLALADINLREARFLSLLLQNLEETDFTVISALKTGLAVSYARGFVQNDGIGPLGDLFAQFPTDDLRSTHEALMSFRHKIYAHRDLSSSESFRLEDAGSLLPYDVSIEFHEALTGFDLVVSTPQFPDELLPRIVQLCDFQALRIREELKKAVEPHLDAEKFFAHRPYKIGVDFP